MRFLFTIPGALVIAAFASSAQPQLANGVKAIVHDSIVTYHQVNDLTMSVLRDVARTARNMQELERERARLMDENTERLIEQELILKEFADSGFAVPESVIDDFVEQRIRERYSNRAAMARSLQEEGMTFERYRERIRKEFIVYQMRLKNSQAVIISPHKIERYYAAHTNDFVVEDQVKLSMITLTNNPADPEQTVQVAKEILARIDAGASFAEMATVYSHDSRRSQGGRWDWQKTSGLREEFIAAVKDLEPGRHSGVIRTPEACFLILVEDKRPAHVRPLSEVRDEIEATLLREERQRLQDQWISRLKRKTFVRYF
ncbi:MAG TPA: hypothetical protein GYA07_01320 [Verrucomicrobia bacterium]|nr:hypothetical protein [Verrucomicrobiota bacterium]HOB32813.1 peptidylprolyl isomerase [Verrucomicrobiota bacterium]HOP96972.1 peptidylprolyl isomerase [Verrucomicrobiota bacterium]HPU55867.1 peptidylprolyl isomerase [Verrucomicrobiota bacterium]